MSSPREKLQELLRELFQFGSADLDFGIYRIMNFKRDVIERFIQRDLIEAVDKELSSGMLASQSQAASELKEVAAQIREQLDENALNGDGTLAKEFHNTKLGRHYLELQSRIVQAQERPALETTIFNHLYAFFSRYYDNGDFLSKRRYSRREKYAIPYNGEEVYLHWANSDQYYVKTGEYFNDYRFKSPYGISVHFMLIAADIDKDNVKGDRRFFVPVSHGVTYDAETREITIPFQYRPLTEQEDIKYGQCNQQDAIITEALEVIPAEFKKDSDALPALVSVHHTAADGQQVSYLEHHLRRYARRNTSDFSVHKDLKGFLTRELDFYLKNEVLNLDEIEAAGEPRSEAWFQIMHVIRSIGSRVIEFLAQIENFQKRLFEKRKFILETQYCITMANVPEDFHSEIAQCEAQWQEWKALFHLDEEQPNLFVSTAKNQKQRRIATLKEHPTLVLDPKHFDQQFKDRLLATYDNLDEVTDGLLIHGDNFQVMRLLLEGYRGRVNCIYNDPPYNTGSDRFLYKDSYQHSSWLSMIDQSTKYARLMLEDTGSFMQSCDENELTQLGLTLRQIFGPDNHVETIIWNKRVPKNDKGIGNIHEYVFLFSNDLRSRRNGGKSFIMRKDGLDEIYEIIAQAKRKKLSLPNAQEVLKEFYRKQGFDRGITLYCELDTNYEIWGKINMAWPSPQSEGPRYKVISPVTNKPVPIPRNGWRWKEETFRMAEENGPTYKLPDGSMMKGRIWYPPDIYTQPSSITYLREVESFLLRSFLSIKSDGSITLDNLGLGGSIDYPKPVPLIECLCYSVDEKEGLFADFFAGSGVTGHALINLNRSDGGYRKFVLVEIGDYFNTVLLPRIKKVTFTPEWKDGKPTRQASTEEAERSPRIVKYVRLESYEDALNNITFPDVPKTLYDFDDYLLKYMLAWETKESETLLNVEKLASPFSYKLTITSGEDTQQKPVDIPETFAYLLGLHVKTRRVYQDKERYYLVYRGNIDHREIVVIWREAAGWEKEDYERDKQFVEEQKLAEGVNEIFVNGDSYIPKARALESVFKSRMFGSL